MDKNSSINNTNSNQTTPKSMIGSPLMQIKSFREKAFTGNSEVDLYEQLKN